MPTPVTDATWPVSWPNKLQKRRLKAFFTRKDGHWSLGIQWLGSAKKHQTYMLSLKTFAALELAQHVIGFVENCFPLGEAADDAGGE